MKWDGVQIPTWVHYQNVEILGKRIESSPAENLQSDESGIEYYSIEIFPEIKSGTWPEILSFYAER